MEKWMALTPEQLSGLERLGSENVRQLLDQAGVGPLSAVIGVCEIHPKRGDVQDWLAQLEGKASLQLLQLQERTLWWAKAAAWIGAASIIVSIIIAWLQSR